eukprot:3607454-Prymnesium_polylepis.1
MLWSRCRQGQRCWAERLQLAWQDDTIAFRYRFGGAPAMCREHSHLMRAHRLRRYHASFEPRTAPVSISTAPPPGPGGTRLQDFTEQ